MVQNFNNWLVDFKAGNRDATNVLYNEYRPIFVKWMRKKHRCSDEDAIDVFQDSIIILYKNAQKGKLDDLQSKLQSYLFGIGQNVFLRRITRQKKTSPEEELKGVESPEIGIEKQLQLKDRKKMISQLLKKMRDPCQSILYYFFYRRYSMEAIQKTMDYSSPEVVRTQKKRCIIALQKQMKKQFKRADL